MASNTFSENIFEAKVKSVDYSTLTCSISPINTNEGSIITGVPLPYIAGKGNVGFFYGIDVDTRVLAMFTSGRSRNVTVIVSVIPDPTMTPANFDPLNPPSETTSGTLRYPKMKDGEVILRANSRAKFAMQNNGDIIMTGMNGGGLRILRNKDKTSGFVAVEDFVQFSNAGRLITGSVRRMTGSKRKSFPLADLTSSPLFSDPEYSRNSKPIGFFTGSKPIRRTFDSQKRNPEISEYRLVINEFATDSMFTGFDNEVLRANSQVKFFDNMESYQRNREPNNVLHLAEHELIEFIGGNLVDINGLVLDINYKKLNYGGPRNTIPDNLNEKSYEDARKISRRGVGCHFQLSTNTKTEDPSQSNTNFVFDIDKQGMLKLNIPASTNFGNIPFSNNVDYVGGDGDQPIVSVLNASEVEPTPVTLRDENGKIVLPDVNTPVRPTGIRVLNENDPAYFGSSSGESRINTTKYHNMYSAAERLIANTVKRIYIPPAFSGGTSIFKPFEIAMGKVDSLPTYMSSVEISPGSPAIYHGGGGGSDGMAIAGNHYEDSYRYPEYSNTTDDSRIAEDPNLVSQNSVAASGGKSVHANLEGSVEMSVGKDKWDQKSIVLDTAGSIISWLGKDKNGRSMVLQTDGDVLVNIGGSYSGSGSEPKDKKMNVGRLDIRVNVTDKGFVTSTYLDGKPQNDGGNPGGDSDYLISISEKGLVIAGMKKEAPMVIRNDGPLLLESSSAAVTIKGTQVITVDAKNIQKIVDPATRN